MSGILRESQFVEVLDEHGKPRLLPLHKVLEIERKRIMAQEKALNIQRNQAPLLFVTLPDRPESLDFQRLVKAISDVAVLKDIIPETRDQAIWIRCLQLYWQAKALALANAIYQLIPEPTRPNGPVWRMLPPTALETLKLNVQAEQAWYELLQAGHTEIKIWSIAQGIDYTFNNFEELFVETLKADFEADLSEGVLSSIPTTCRRKQERDHHRRWLKFLGDHFNGEPEEETYAEVLRSIGWKGYALLALREKKRERPFGKLWQNYLKKQRPLWKCLDSSLTWESGIPYQSTEVSGRRTKNRRPIRGVVTDDGYFAWHWR